MEPPLPQQNIEERLLLPQGPGPSLSEQTPLHSRSCYRATTEPGNTGCDRSGLLFSSYKKSLCLQSDPLVLHDNTDFRQTKEIILDKIVCMYFLIRT